MTRARAARAEYVGTELRLGALPPKPAANKKEWHAREQQYERQHQQVHWLKQAFEHSGLPFPFSTKLTGKSPGDFFLLDAEAACSSITS